MPQAAMIEPVPEAAAPPSDRAANAALTIMRLFRAMERVDAGLTPPQYRMLMLIGAGGERSARLAERLAVAKPTLTSTADGLVAAGLLSRESDTADRRAVRLRLTEAGQAAANHAGGVYAGWLGQLLDATDAPDRLLGDFEALDLALGQAIDQARIAKLAARSAGVTPVPGEAASRGSGAHSVSAKKKAPAASAQSARRPPE